MFEITFKRQNPSSRTGHLGRPKAGVPKMSEPDTSAFVNHHSYGSTYVSFTYSTIAGTEALFLTSHLPFIQSGERPRKARDFAEGRSN